MTSNLLAAPRDAVAILRPAVAYWLATNLLQAAFCLAVTLWPAGYSLYSLVYPVVMFALTVWCVRGLPDAWRLWQRPRPRMLEACLLIAVMAFFLLDMWHRAMPDMGPDSAIEWLRRDGWTLWGALASVGIAMPILEEVGYRGLLLGRLLHVAPAPMAIVVQATLFASSHMDGYRMFELFAFGVVVGVLRIAAGALWPRKGWRFWADLEHLGVRRSPSRCPTPVPMSPCLLGAAA